VLRQLPGFPKIVETVRRGGAVHVHKLVGSSKSLLVSEIRRETGRPVVYVAPDEERAEAVRFDLEHFLGPGIDHLAEHRTRPYDVKPSHSETVAARLETLAHAASGTARVIVASAAALAERVPSPDLLRRHMIELDPGATVDLEELAARFTALGYNRAQAVEEVGDFAMRGGIVDVYSLGGTHPLRVEIDYDEITSVREFDVHTQRSVRRLDRAVVYPRHEILLDREGIRNVVAELAARDPDLGRELEEAFDTAVHPVGIERMAGALHQDLRPFFDYLPPGTLVVVEEPGEVRGMLESHWDEVVAAHQACARDFPAVSSPEELYLSPPALSEELRRFGRAHLSDLSPDPGEAEPVPVRSHPPDSYGRKIDLWRRYLSGLAGRGLRVVITCDNEGQQQRLRELLVDEGVPVILELGVLSGGFVIDEAGLAVLTDHEFFGRARRRARPRRFRSGFGLKELRSLQPGSYVVHVEHGVGRYVGLNRLEINGHLTDVLELHYQGGDKLYVPVDQLDLVQRYSSEEGRKPALSRLGGTAWTKTKSRAKKAIQEMAGELLRTYALRKAHPGHAFPPDTVWQRELEGSFPYDETPDQSTAVEAVKQDMESPNPMDRLICGDVGYGKTEVAVRAVFKAVMEGKQAAVLVPTTILAEQHWNTLRDRFADFPVEVDMLSRFRSAKEQKGIKTAVARGEVDVVVGTHALLSGDVLFKNLGLIVVDEEQRFGVKHKERLRTLKANVDVLTLTATPIPRTLNLSLLGARDITIIQTPPVGRMPVQTEIAEFSRDLIRDALLREADRGGQSFFVHNRVHSIFSMASYLRKLCPQLEFGVAHGRMASRNLETVMVDFVKKKYDVLVATMIIENGLDIPSVNTMLVNRADAFGLAQLYQLRGRVGRSTQKAYCAFLIPQRRALNENAMKRLRAIAEFDELGSGFALAMRDLEIRGAGNILGQEQSGFVVSVGFEMYCRLLEEAVRELKGLPLEDRPEPRVHTDVDAFLPDDYVEDAEEKVAFYKRLADARDPEAVAELEAELTDRFGRLYREAEGLFDLRRVRVLGGELGIRVITIRGNKIEMELAAPPTPGTLKGWMQRIRQPVEFAATGRFVLKAAGGVAEALDLLGAMSAREMPIRGG
jgi:transcription-repair coupling factor (superfamily II helicase)